MRKLGFGGGAETNFGIGGGAGPSGSAYCANNEPWPPARDKAPGNTEGAAPLRLNCACAASCSLDTFTPGGGAPGPVFGRPAKMPGGGAMPGGGGGGAAPGLNPGGRAPRRCAMLFMVDACFRRAVHAGRARRCSGFLRELSTDVLFWSPPLLARAWALRRWTSKHFLFVGGALSLTYGLRLRPRPPLRAVFASALPTLARAANLALVTAHTPCV